MGFRLVVLGGLIGLVTGLVVGSIIWGDDEYWAALGVAFGGLMGCVAGATVGLSTWLVRLWSAQAPLAVPATLGAVGGVAVWVLVIWIDDVPRVWLMFVSLPATALGLAAASFAAAAHR